MVLPHSKEIIPLMFGSCEDLGEGQRDSLLEG
jgi:hypothetical protein